MKTDLHLAFPGTCNEAFGFYEETFGSKRGISMTFGDAPGGSPVPEEAKDQIMYTSMPLGSMLLMGGDDPGRTSALGGFRVSILLEDVAEVNRLFAALSAGGSVDMPLAKTFWSPLFGACTDKFGVGWMVGVPGTIRSE